MFADLDFVSRPTTLVSGSDTKVVLCLFKAPFGFKLGSAHSAVLGNCRQFLLDNTTEERDLVPVVSKGLSTLYRGISGLCNCT